MHTAVTLHTTPQHREKRTNSHYITLYILEPLTVKKYVITIANSPLPPNLCKLPQNAATKHFKSLPNDTPHLLVTEV